MTVTRMGLYASADLTGTMKEYIREHFAELLGPYAALLDQPGGLDLLSSLIRSGQIPTRRKL
jgi:hypothetical protein